jgi:hypothetical protein
MAVDSEVSMLDETSFVGFHHHDERERNGARDGIAVVGDDSMVFGFEDVLDSGRGGAVALAYGFGHGHGHGSRLDRISVRLFRLSALVISRLMVSL